MNGSDFFHCLAAIAGEENIKRYAYRFGKLDERIHENTSLLNYEALGFYVYTTAMGWHDVINSELWSKDPSYHVLMFRDVMNSALSKVSLYRNNNGIVFRGYAAGDLDGFLTSYKVGGFVTFPGFTSAAFDEKNAFGGNVLFTIRSLTARAVWYLCADFKETEVLIAAGKSFLVVAVERHEDRAVITLEEMP